MDDKLHAKTLARMVWFGLRTKYFIPTVPGTVWIITCVAQTRLKVVKKPLHHHLHHYHGISYSNYISDAMLHIYQACAVYTRHLT